MAFLELLSYSGYKFVSLCIVVAADGIFGTMGSYGALAVTGGLFGWFFFKTLKRSLQSNSLADYTKEVALSKQTFLLATTAAELFILWVLSCQY